MCFLALRRRLSAGRIARRLLGICRETASGTRASSCGCRCPRCSALRIEERHGDMELRTDPYLALDPNAPAVSLNEMLGNRQAEARASGLAGARHVHAIKALEDARLIGLRNADARIADGQDHFLVLRIRAQNYFSTRQSVLDGVVEEVLQNFLQPARVA